MEPARLGPAHREDAPRQPLPPGSRLHVTISFAPERLYRPVDALEAVAADTGRTVPQVALNWLLQRPTFATALVGGRDACQRGENPGAADWALTTAQVAQLDSASDLTPPWPYYPYWDGMFTELNPADVPVHREHTP